jgi:hypothetical protein
MVPKLEEHEILHAGPEAPGIKSAIIRLKEGSSSAP